MEGDDPGQYVGYGQTRRYLSGVDFKKDAGASEIKTADGATTMNLCSGEYEMILKK